MTGTLTTAIPRDEYQAILLGEIGCERQIERMLEYTTGSDRLHTAYSFALMGPDHSVHPSSPTRRTAGRAGQRLIMTSGERRAVGSKPGNRQRRNGRSKVTPCY
jgi:hypothetical protein